MVGKDPFQLAANAIALKENLRAATCKARFVDNRRASTWRCPANTQGRYVRVQLETYNSLSLAEVQVCVCMYAYGDCVGEYSVIWRHNQRPCLVNDTYIGVRLLGTLQRSGSGFVRHSRCFFYKIRKYDSCLSRKTLSQEET
jgi:hypothetical protein